MPAGTRSSATAEAGLALLDEGAHAFREILARRAVGKALRLGLELRLERARERAAQEALGVAVGMGGPGGKALGERLGGTLEFGHGHHLVDEAERQCGGGIEALGQKRDLRRLLHADDARQMKSARAVRARADERIGEREEGILRGDGEVARHDEAHPEAGGGTADARDHRLRHAADGEYGRMHLVHEEFEASAPLGGRKLQAAMEELEVAAGHEMLGSTSHDDGAHRGVGFERREGLLELARHRLIERIECRGAVEDDGRDRTLARHQHGIWHRTLLAQGPWRNRRTKAAIAAPISCGESSWMKWLPLTATSSWLGQRRQ